MTNPRHAHSPTPWAIYGDPNDPTAIVTGERQPVHRRVIARVDHPSASSAFTEAECAANARLIAAAVNTHADAVELAHSLIAWRDDPNAGASKLAAVVERARALLAKSEGR